MRNFCVRVAWRGMAWHGVAQRERGNAIRRHANPYTGTMHEFPGGLQSDQRQSERIFDKAIFLFVHSAVRLAVAAAATATTATTTAAAGV